MLAKLENGVLKYAPKKLATTIDGKPVTILNPSETMLKNEGYKPVEYGEIPNSVYGYDVSYLENLNSISVIYTAKNISADYIRSIRKENCFDIINRSQLWYKKLTQENINELEAWYQAWLDAPQTLIIPTKPSWLK